MSVTLRDVADSLGVSTSTISRTLNNQGRISRSTRKLILEKMEEMGFTPNVNAQRLKSGRAYVVALDYGANLPDDMYFAELTRGIRDALAKFRYNLMLNVSADNLRQLVSSQAVDGVIVFGGGPEEIERLQALAVEGTPCVLIGHCDMSPSLNFAPVCTDLSFGAYEVADFLIDKGHSRIAFLGSYEDDLVLAALRERLLAREVPLDDDLVAFAGASPERAEAVTCDLMRKPMPPTAVFARTDALAAGALRALHHLGLKVPGDVSLVGHDDVPFARLMTPALTTVRIDCGVLGSQAVEAILMMLDNPGVSMRQRIVRPSLVARDTVAPPRSSLTLAARQ